MDKMARDFADDMFFVFVYVREAHPDTHPDWPAHRSLEQKVAQAGAMRDRHQTPRTIVIDRLEGDVHKLYGGMPNMSWIVDHAGIIAYKAAWTSEIDLRAAIEEVLKHKDLKRESGTALFYKETLSVNPSRMRDGRTGPPGMPGMQREPVEAGAQPPAGG